MVIDSKRATNIALLLIVVATVLRALLFFFGDIELHYDEAQYWEWSQRLDWGYYSKGPLIAWLIAFSEALFGHGIWQTRLPAWCFSALFMWLLFRCTVTVWGSEISGIWAVILSVACPVYFLLGGVMTTDILLFLFYTWGIWAAYKAIVLKRSSAWVELGIAVGLGCLTKLSMLLLPFALSVILLVTANYRYLLWHKGPWLAALIAFLITFPMLWWNANNDWVLFQHELGHVVGKEGETDGYALRFLGEQAIAFLPLFLGVLLILFGGLRSSLSEDLRGREKEKEGKHFLWGLVFVGFVFFLFKSLSGKVQINWPSPVYIGLIILVAGAIPKMRRGQKVFLKVSFILMGCLTVIAIFPGLIGVKEKSAGFKEMKGWSSPVKKLYNRVGQPDFIFVLSYKLAGELAFFWPESVPVYVISHEERRRNQHDLWPGVEQEAGKNALYIDTVNRPPNRLEQAFLDCTPTDSMKVSGRDGSLIRTLYFKQCHRYAPVDWPQPSGY